MNWHPIWMWVWFFIGVLMYWLKRAYFMVQPPNPVATGYAHFIERAWVPLLVRFFADSILFWILFTPALAAKALSAMGWTNWSWGVTMITQFAPVSAMFGFFSDSVLDIAVSKIPWVKDVLPQMPGPMATNVNPTDQKLVDAKANVDAAADKLQDVGIPGK
jgi:hypothetical protein